MAVKSLAQSSIRQAPPVNSLLAGYSFQDFHHLETVQLGGAAASVTFNNLLQYSGEFRHLQLRYTARTDRTAGGTFVSIRFNGDSGANYSYHNLFGTGSSVGSSASGGITRILAGEEVSNSATANTFSGGVIDILEPFSSSKNTTIRALSGHASSANSLSMNSGAWFNTASVTSMQLLCWDGTNHMAGSRFSLYGVK